MLLKGRNRNTNRRENEGIPAINLTLLEADDSGSLWSGKPCSVSESLTTSLTRVRVRLFTDMNWRRRSSDSFKKWKIDVCFLDSAVRYKSMTTEVSSKPGKKQTMTMPERESTNATVSEDETRGSECRVKPLNRAVATQTVDFSLSCSTCLVTSRQSTLTPSPLFVHAN